ncbi:unknown protein [Paenibacillus amylolyticus]|uniref:Uncharacterized protein n=1 Tax=Paenibacillus amylolyticus TaxID=1451 RepID=A0A100VNQ5_PAEAM|nr:unknown protein [Paenibacillus amylolyticus]
MTRFLLFFWKFLNCQYALSKGIVIETSDMVDLQTISDEKFVEMIYDYEMQRDLIENGTMIDGNLRVRTPDI